MNTGLGQVYRDAIGVFGPVQPFSNVARAEDRHASALLRQFRRLDVHTPEARWAGHVEAPASMAAACEAAVAGKVENAAMYDCILAIVDDSVVRNVLLTLQDASLNRHLPAFRR